MKKIILNNIEYEIIEDYKNGFDKDIIIEKLTDYFEPEFQVIQPPVKPLL